MKEYDIEELSKNLDFKSGEMVNIGNGIFLTNREIEILEIYQVPYKNCHTLKEIIFNIEKVMEEMDIPEDELDLVSSSIAERDYYQNTNY
ncbi:MAG: hypothetical protein IJI60_00070 [Bacilli bacterium]|nr:hypothetical protein [Bacilli bacterium]